MHVLPVVDSWGLTGGSERYALNVLSSLRSRGHRVSVLCRHVHSLFCPELNPALVEALFSETAHVERLESVLGRAAGA